MKSMSALRRKAKYRNRRRETLHKTGAALASVGALDKATIRTGLKRSAIKSKRACSRDLQIAVVVRSPLSGDRRSPRPRSIDRGYSARRPSKAGLFD